MLAIILQLLKIQLQAHAELEAIDAAGTLLGNHRLIDCDMYVTVELVTCVQKQLFMQDSESYLSVV